MFRRLLNRNGYARFLNPRGGKPLIGPRISFGTFIKWVLILGLVREVIRAIVGG